MSNLVNSISYTVVYRKGEDSFEVNFPDNVTPFIPPLQQRILATEIDEHGNDQIKLVGIVAEVLQSHEHSMETDTLSYKFEIELQ